MIDSLHQDDRFTEWMTVLESRHLAELTFPEVSRSLRALSSNYVERRTRLNEGVALNGAGKRAAFALFYGPLHFLLVRHIVTSIPRATAIDGTLVDLGCGTGAAGAAWASASERLTSSDSLNLPDRSRRTYRLSVPVLINSRFAAVRFAMVASPPAGPYGQ